MSRWYRRYAGTVSDPKLAEAALIAECPRAVIIATWDMILESAAETNEIGKFRATSRNVAATIYETVETIDRAFAAFQTIGMIADGVVVAWSKRQFQSDSSTERSRKHRASKQSNGAATELQRCATPPEPEPDPDPESYKHSAPSPPEQEAGRARDAKTLVNEGLGKGGVVSPEARRRVSARLAISDADPLVALYENWPLSRSAKSADALFTSVAEQLYLKASPIVRAACRPLADEPVSFAPKEMPRASAALRKTLVTR